MRTTNPMTLALVLLAAMMFAVGCSETNDLTGTVPSSGNSMDDIDLNKAYGGLAYTDETEAFGDTDLLNEALVEDTAALDEAESEEELLDDSPEIDRDNLVRTYLRIVWGQMDGDPARTDELTDAERNWTTWDGTVSVSEGVIVLRKTILFERGTDHRLPRTDRQTVGFHSVTGPHVDGVLMCILSEPTEDGSLPGEVTFRTGPLTQSYAIAEIADLSETIRVDDLGNAVSFEGIVDRPDVCPSGFLGGYWINLPNTNGGFFQGHWVSQHGRLGGFLRGRWGTNDAGENVFAGKILARGGRIRGLMQGVWEPSGNDDGMGTFVGRWVNRNGEHMGVLRGQTRSGGPRDGGFFQGGWAEICDAGDDDGDEKP